MTRGESERRIEDSGAEPSAQLLFQELDELVAVDVVVVVRDRAAGLDYDHPGRATGAVVKHGRRQALAVAIQPVVHLELRRRATENAVLEAAGRRRGRERQAAERQGRRPAQRIAGGECAKRRDGQISWFSFLMVRSPHLH